ncbi:hypothetical protein JG687_00013760, partial [Phytophthora cactorum]
QAKQVSVLAAYNVEGFFVWSTTENTFTRQTFNETFKSKILPFLNPRPLPRSIVILNNAKIHMYQTFQELIHDTGALMFFLPPYSPDLNPIEIGFSLLKRWIIRHANMTFREHQLTALNVAMHFVLDNLRKLEKIVCTVATKGTNLA